MSIAMQGISIFGHETQTNKEIAVNRGVETSLFSGDELLEFAADDAEAGRRIGKILSALFIYTLLAMSVAVWWTLKTVGH